MDEKRPCPVCEEALALKGDLMAGELIDCGTCGSELEITSLNPLELVEAPMVGEDWGQ